MMRRGPWHQCGFNNQKMINELLSYEIGVGVVLSMRDMAFRNAIEYANYYRLRAAEILIDPQFYIPDFLNGQLITYPITDYRTRISKLNQINSEDLISLELKLIEINDQIRTNGVIAPAVVYEAGRPDIVELNARLFNAAKNAGDKLRIPTYATVILGNSICRSTISIDSILSKVTELDCDGYYFGFEFNPERIPSSKEFVLRCCNAGLILSCTGKPVFHAFAGPMALLSFGFGATAAGIGHSQNLWKFSRERFESPASQGGGGAAASRFFSKALWGTLIFPDEVALLDESLLAETLTPSPFAVSNLSIEWKRWEAHKHLIYVVALTLTEICQSTDARSNANSAIELLDRAVDLHLMIGASNINLSDNTNSYQSNWRDAMSQLLNDNVTSFDYLEMLG